MLNAFGKFVVGFAHTLVHEIAHRPLNLLGFLLLVAFITVLFDYPESRMDVVSGVIQLVGLYLAARVILWIAKPAQ